VKFEPKDFSHRVRLYYLSCASHVLKLAPLPEFRNAVLCLDAYDKQPTTQNEEKLKKVLRGLRKGDRTYGYTAVGEFYWGLRLIIWRSIYRPFSVGNFYAQHFAEACWCAAYMTGDCKTAESALHAEYDWQWAMYSALFHTSNLGAARPSPITVQDACIAANGAESVVMRHLSQSTDPRTGTS